VQLLRIAFLGVLLLSALVTSGRWNRIFLSSGEPRSLPRGYDAAGAGAVFAVLFASLVVPLPVALFTDHELPVPGQPWSGVALAVAAASTAFAVTRRVSPSWWKPWHLWIAGRAAPLPVLVVGVELLCLRDGVPLHAQLSRLWLVSLVVTAGYLACWRVADTGYWPVPLMYDGVWYLAVGFAVGWWHVAAGGSLTPGAVGTAELAVVLLLWAMASIGVSALCVGGWRLRRWLRDGPPFWPRPPGVWNWPPEPGEVWNATVVHDDGDHKDRPVVVWDRQANYAEVLTVTSVDKSHRPRDYVALHRNQWDDVLSKASWLSVELTPVPYSDFRSMRGDCPPRFWQWLVDHGPVRQRHPSAGPAPVFTRRHRLASARNRRFGVDARTRSATPTQRRPSDPTPRSDTAGHSRRRR
jgi:hypothetical protein